MAVELDPYKKEIFSFLRTLSVKFDAFAYLMGSDYMEEYGLTDPHGEWNPYYLNLAGQYSSNDTRMVVYSPEEERQVPYDLNLAVEYPRTALLYKVGTKEYTNLQERYPDQLGLIRCIAYPAKSVQAAIEADNFSLLAYDASFLHENERESLVKCLAEFFTMVRTRWWIDEFRYEDMYALTFWGMIWQYLPVLLFTQRFLNIRTPYAHPFHIWEYLKSKGLEDYRDVLTNQQSLWLYRNIDYILKNKGKSSNLLILAENLLGEIFVSLLGKDMYQETATRWDTQLSTNPAFRSFNLITGEEVKTESFNALNKRMVDAEIENRDSAEFVDEEEYKLATHPHNVLPTKFLELKKEPIDTSDERYMVNFFLDTLMYRYSRGDLKYALSFVDPVFKNQIKLSVGDTIALWYYTLMRSIEITPEVIPNKWVSYTAIQTAQPSMADLNQSVFTDGEEHDIKAHANMSKMLGMLSWHPRSFVKQADFMDMVCGQFRALLQFKNEYEQSNKVIYHLAVHSILNDITIKKCFNLQLTNYETYEEWIHENIDIRNLVSGYDKQGNPEEIYLKLCELIFDTLFPLDSATAAEFIGNIRQMEKLFTAVRNLFIKLCSYYVRFLESDRDKCEYLKLLPVDVVWLGQDISLGGLWSFIMPTLHFDRTSINDPGGTILALFEKLDVVSTVYGEQRIHGICLDLNQNRKSIWSGGNRVLMLNEILRTGTSVSSSSYFTKDTPGIVMNFSASEEVEATEEI